MAIFFDGVTDSLDSSMLASIQWEIRYGVLGGWSVDSPAWEQLLGKEEHGTYQWSAAEICGGTTYTVRWTRDNKWVDDGYKQVVKFSLIDAVQPF